MPRARRAKKSAAPRQPKLPRFSPTRISLYIFCPRAYYLYYVSGLRWGALSAGHAVGGSLHRTLQVFHARGGAGQVPLEELREHLREKWLDRAFASPEEAAAQLAAGEAALERHYEAELHAGRETVWTEKTVQHRYGEFVLFGRIDRLDRRPDGALEIIDYKSGRYTVSEEEVRGSLALKIYQLILARQNPGVPVYAGICCLRSGEEVAVLRSPEELDALEQEITAVVQTILRDEEMQALPGEQCRSCVYPRVCPPGRRWLAEHPETRT